MHRRRRLHWSHIRTDKGDSAWAHLDGRIF